MTINHKKLIYSHWRYITNPHNHACNYYDLLFEWMKLYLKYWFYCHAKQLGVKTWEDYRYTLITRVKPKWSYNTNSTWSSELNTRDPCTMLLYPMDEVSLQKEGTIILILVFWTFDPLTTKCLILNLLCTFLYNSNVSLNCLTLWWM